MSLLLFAFVFLIPHFASALDEVDRLEMRAQAAVEEKNYLYAIQCWSDAIKLSPDEAALYVNRAQTYAAMGDHEKEQADYAQATQVQGDDARAYQLRADGYRAKREEATRIHKTDPGDTDMAVGSYDQVVRIQFAGNADAGAVAKAAEAAARDAHKKANYELEIAYWSAVVKAQPKNAAAWFRRAVIYSLLGESDKALADCEAALKADPKHADAALMRDQLQAGWNGGANGDDYIPYRQNGENASAIALSSEQIWMNPDNGGGYGDRMAAEAYGHRADVYALEGKYDQALADYEEAMRRAPDDFELHEGRGYVYMQAGQYEKAGDDFVKMNEGWRKNPESQYDSSPDHGKDAEDGMSSQYNVKAAEAYMRAGDWAKATEVLKAGLAIDPADSWQQNALAWLYATCPDEKYRDGGKAIDLAKRGGDRDTLAAACAEVGRWDEAVAGEKEAIGDDEAEAKKLEANPGTLTPATLARYKSAGDKELMEYQARLKSYGEKKPWRGAKELPVGN